MKSLPTLIACPIILLGFFIGCDSLPPGSPEAAPKGDRKKTIEFWNAYGEAISEGVGIEALSKGIPTDMVPVPILVEEYTALISTEKERSDKITSLPLLGVDPYLTDYAVRHNSARTEVAREITSMTIILEQHNQSLSGENMLGRLILNMFKNLDQKQDEILWKSLADYLNETAHNVDSNHKDMEVLFMGASAAARNFSAIISEEFEVRAKLTQRYNHEFRPLGDFFAGKKPPYEFSGPSEEWIKSFLQGKSVNENQSFIPPVWRFDEKDTWKNIKIDELESNTPALRVFSVEVTAQGARSKRVVNFKFRMSFAELYTKAIFLEYKQVFE
jgi:hypothetical protein